MKHKMELELVIEIQFPVQRWFGGNVPSVRGEKNGVKEGKKSNF